MSMLGFTQLRLYCPDKVNVSLLSRDGPGYISENVGDV